MASGRTHWKIHAQMTAFVVPSAGVTFLVLPTMFPAVRVEYFFAWCGGWFISPILTPDLDVDSADINRAWLLKNFHAFGLVWVILWRPYSLWFRHRGYSHTIIGALLRLSYFGSIICFLVFLWGAIASGLLYLDQHGVYWFGFDRGWLIYESRYNVQWSIDIIRRLIRLIWQHKDWLMVWAIGQTMADLLTHYLPDRYWFVREI